MRRELVPVLLLCALGTVAMVRCEAQTFKLCGREFIRAVIYTCGGSRWRRILDEQELKDLQSKNQRLPEVLTYSIRTHAGRRDLNEVLTAVCCELGCRKSDLTLFC